MYDYINEAFKRLSLLQEETFDTSAEGLTSLSNFLNNDENDDIVKVIDPNVDNNDDLSDSYIGKVIINCNVCHSNIFKSKEDVVINSEGAVNNEDACPYCGESEGFTIIGQVDKFVEETDEDESENIEVSVNDEPVEDEEGNEEDKEDLDEGFIGGAVGGLAGNSVGKTAGKAIGMAVGGPLGAVAGKAIGGAVGSAAGALAGSAIQNKLSEEGEQPLYDQLKEFLASKGYSVSTKEGKNYLWSVVDYIMDARDTLGEYSIEAWYRDTKENCPEDLELFESVECNGEDCDEGLLGGVVGGLAGNAIAGKLGGGLIGKAIGTAAGAWAGSKIQNKLSEDEEISENEEQLVEADLTQIEGTVADVLNKHSVELDDLAYSEAAVKDFVARVLRDECKYDSQAEEAIRKINSCRGGKLWSTLGTYMTGIKVVNNKKLVSSVEDDATAGEELNEDVNNVNVETDDTVVSVSEDDGKVTVTTEPKEPEVVEGEEMISPVSDELMTELEVQNDLVDEPVEEPIEDSEEEIDIEEADEDSINELGEAYLTRVYENVKSFKTTNMYVSENDSSLIVEGLITFNSGATKKTGFVFEPSVVEKGKVKFTGKNEHFSRGNKSFTLVGTVDNKKLIAESLTYNYRAKNGNGSNRVYGTVKRG